MPILALLDRVCDIWGPRRADPEVEDAEDTEGIVFPGVPCRVDSILYRRSIESAATGGAQGLRRAIIFIQDNRLLYPTTFNEDNWIVQNTIRWDILSIDEADDLIGLHHYEVNCQAGVTR
jgi:hypothetical protein